MQVFGLIPIIPLLLVGIILTASTTVYKGTLKASLESSLSSSAYQHIPLNEAQPTADKGFQANKIEVSSKSATLSSKKPVNSAKTTFSTSSPTASPKTTPNSNPTNPNQNNQIDTNNQNTSQTSGTTTSSSSSTSTNPNPSPAPIQQGSTITESPNPATTPEPTPANSDPLGTVDILALVHPGNQDINLSNGRIRIKDPVSGQVLASGTTDYNGRLRLTGVPGNRNIEVVLLPPSDSFTSYCGSKWNTFLSSGGFVGQNMRLAEPGSSPCITD